MSRIPAIVVAAFAVTTPALAQTPPATPPPAELTDEDLADLEAATAADTATVSNTILNPDLAFILDVAAGYVSGGDLDIPLELEMAAGKAVDPYFRFDGVVAFSPEGAEIEEAYATTLALPLDLQVRAGQFLTRFGRQNGTHAHTWELVDRPFALERVFGEEGLRGPGAEVSYLTPLPFYVELVGSATLPAIPIDHPKDLQVMTAAKTFFELDPDWSLLWGASWTTGPNDLGAGKRTHVVGTDVFLKWRPITRQSYQQIGLQTEWLYRTREVPGKTWHPDVDGYAQLGWRFAQRWATAARWEYGSGADLVALDDLDPGWTEDRHRFTSSLSFYPTEFSRVRVQGSVDLPAWADPVYAGVVALEVAAGAHGSHSF